MRKVLLAAALLLAALPALAESAYVTEFRFNPAVTYQTALTPSLVNQKLSLTSSSAQSAAFNKGTQIVRVVCTVECWIDFGVNPTATTSKIRLAANAVEYFTVASGQKIAVISQ